MAHGQRRQHGHVAAADRRARPGQPRPAPDDRRRGARRRASARSGSVNNDTNVTPVQFDTAGSSAIQSGGPPVRAAAATAKQALLDLAATNLGVAEVDPDGRQGRRLGRRPVGHLRRAARRQAVQRPHAPPRRTAAPGVARDEAGRQYKLVDDARLPRVDIPAKVTGRTSTRTTSGSRGCCTAGSCGRAARAPTAPARRRSRLGRRELDQAHRRRAGRPQRRLRRRRRPDGVRRDPGGRPAQGEVGRDADDLPGAGNLWKQMRDHDSGRQGSGARSRRTRELRRGVRVGADKLSAELQVPLQRPRADRPVLRRRRRDAAGRAHLHEHAERLPTRAS